MPDMNIVAKIKKLLALAQSDNPNEAALAAARARELMIQHAIEEAALTQSEREPIDREWLNLDTRRIPHWEALLAYVLAPHFFCRSYYVKGCDINVVGRKSDREALIATFFYLRGEIRKMADKAWATKPTNFPVHGKTWKNGFYEGCVQTVKARLEDEQAKLTADTTGTAIVLAQRQTETDTWVKENMDVRLSKSTRTVNVSGYVEGVQAGKTLDLSKRAGASKALVA